MIPYKDSLKKDMKKSLRQRERQTMSFNLALSIAERLDMRLAPVGFDMKNAVIIAVYETP